MRTSELATPALVVDADALARNLGTAAAVLPGPRLRPHVKAHKCTGIARAQAARAHRAFTCATPREVLGMAAAGLGEDLLLANEVVDGARLAALAAAQDGARITVAVDSDATVDAAARAGLREVLVDVRVGLPRCGCAPEDAGRLADRARAAGMRVRGVMGYEGHLMTVADRAERARRVGEAMAILARAARDVGGEVVSAGGTGTWDLHEGAATTEVQAGSYALMDTHYARVGLPFVQAAHVLGTVVSVSREWAVADVGLKALGMDHGDPRVEGWRTWYCSDEHVTFGEEPDGAGRLAALRVGDRVRVAPAHIDPTMAMHEAAWLVRGDEVLERWPIDLRGW
ncbi:MAG: hypothetical protein RL283_589 [Actinomycetota bacterium]|jgi:D-serine deaminase-like pyridoxal phosphate-dependent protein